MNQDLIFGTIIGFSMTLLLFAFIMWRERVDYNKQLTDYAARMNNNASINSYWKKKSAHLKIVRDDD